MGLISRVSSRTYRKKIDHPNLKMSHGYRGTNSQGNSYYKSSSGSKDFSYNNSNGSYYHHANNGGNNLYRDTNGEAHSQKSKGWEPNDKCTHKATNSRGNDYSNFRNDQGVHEY